jgi:hypothetical protein
MKDPMRNPCRGPFLLLLLLIAAGCARKRTTSSAASAVTPLRTMPADSVYVLEAGGTPPADTAVRIAPGRRRAVVLRHGPPDQAAFAVVEFGDSAFTGGDSVTVTIRPRPGVYGLDITTDGPFREARVTFKYARHFAAPIAARERYGDDVRFERQLAVGHLTGDGRIVLLPTRRPTADNLSAELDGPGAYVVAGPK